MSNDKIIIYILVSSLLIYLLIIILNQGVEENMDNYNYKNIGRPVIPPFPTDATINLNEKNSPAYSHTVSLPIVEPISCKNFCGPTGKCVKTGEQCLADIDCYGCNPGPTPQSKCETKSVPGYEDSGKLSVNKGLNYSELTKNLMKGFQNDFAEAKPGSYNTEIGRPYRGLDNWEKTFNDGLQLYNKNQEYNNPLTLFEKDIQPAYPVQLSITGLFYETTPLPGNVPSGL
jgi:hypothetical protein